MTVIGPTAARRPNPPWVSWPSAGYFPRPLEPVVAGRSRQATGAPTSAARPSGSTATASACARSSSGAPGYAMPTLVWQIPARQARSGTYRVVVRGVHRSGTRKTFGRSYDVRMFTRDEPVTRHTSLKANARVGSQPASGRGGTSTSPRRRTPRRTARARRRPARAGLRQVVGDGDVRVVRERRSIASGPWSTPAASGSHWLIPSTTPTNTTGETGRNVPVPRRCTRNGRVRARHVREVVDDRGRSASSTSYGGSSVMCVGMCRGRLVAHADAVLLQWLPQGSGTASETPIVGTADT